MAGGQHCVINDLVVRRGEGGLWEWGPVYGAGGMAGRLETREYRACRGGVTSKGGVRRAGGQGRWA